MRIGWHVHLPGPFSVGGTVGRSDGSAKGCLMALLIAATLIWPYWAAGGSWAAEGAWLAFLAALMVLGRARRDS